jgi:hypothetical protein
MESGFQAIATRRKEKRGENWHVSDDLYPILKQFLKKNNNLELLELENEENKKYFHQSAENNITGGFPEKYNSLKKISFDIWSRNQLFDFVKWILNKYPDGIMRIEFVGNVYMARICGIPLILDPRSVTDLIKNIGISTFKDTFDARASSLREIWNELQKKPMGLQTVANFYVILTGRNFLKVWEKNEAISPVPEPTTAQIIENDEK